jgi:hypothetical protein
MIRIREARLWWGLVWIAAAVTLIRLIVPGAAEIPGSLAVQQFASGTVMCIAVGASVVKLYPPTECEVPYEVFIRGQKAAGTVIGLIVGAVLVVNVWQGQFAESRGWLFLPICFIGPVLYLRDFGREKRRAARVARGRGGKTAPERGT